MHNQRRLANKLQPALADELPLLTRDGGFVRQGYDLALDELRGLRDESRRLIAALQNRYSDETGIASLKIKHNNVLGYHIDVRAAHASKLMDSRYLFTAKPRPRQCGSPQQNSPKWNVIWPALQIVLWLMSWKFLTNYVSWWPTPLIRLGMRHRP